MRELLAMLSVKSLVGRLPSRCQLCQQVWAESGVLCKACSGEFTQKAATSYRCMQCARPMIATNIGECSEPVLKPMRCGQCIQLQPSVSATYVAVDYDPPWSAAVLRFKVNSGNASLSRLAAQVMLQSSEIVSVLDWADVLVPIPSIAGNVRQRGFVPAMQIAKSLKSQAESSVKVLSVLRMKSAVKEQHQLNRKQRFANMRNAFAVDPRRIKDLRNKRVVLVDDVMTTGATIFSAARLLQSAEPESIQAVVWARATNL